MEPVIEFTREHPGWQAYLDHLARVKMLSSLTAEGEPHGDGFYLGVMAAEQVVGHLAFRRQTLSVPASELTHGQEMALTDGQGAPLFEAFVQSFAVEAAHRRQGVGRALQERALGKARELGCYQLRSWSSAGKHENYALKLSLGFAALPALYPLPGGAPISGVYFVRRIDA